MGSECVRCGYCCLQAPCPYGRPGNDGRTCAHLTPAMRCAIHEEIRADPASAMSPAFGAGCSSSLFNSMREDKILRSNQVVCGQAEGCPAAGRCRCAVPHWPNEHKWKKGLCRSTGGDCGEKRPGRRRCVSVTGLDKCDPMKAPRLRVLAAQINARFPDLVAAVEVGWCNTDRKIPGTLFRHPGKGRTGNRLIVKERVTGMIVLDHNAAETYRHNGEVVEKIKDWEGTFQCSGCHREFPGWRRSFFDYHVCVECP